MLGFRNQLYFEKIHLIHWGHIRNEMQNLWKSKMRAEFADQDTCDGAGLKAHTNWFHERNDLLGYNDKVSELPPNVCNYIRKFS